MPRCPEETLLRGLTTTSLTHQQPHQWALLQSPGTQDVSSQTDPIPRPPPPEIIQPQPKLRLLPIGNA